MHHRLANFSRYLQLLSWKISHNLHIHALSTSSQAGDGNIGKYFHKGPRGEAAAPW